jgi:predicted RNA methylase
MTNLTAPIERLPHEATNDLQVEPLVAEHLNRYKFCEQFVRGKNVLDAACGNGFGAYMLAEAGAQQVDAIDISPEAIALPSSITRTSGQF